MFLDLLPLLFKDGNLLEVILDRVQRRGRPLKILPRARRFACGKLLFAQRLKDPDEIAAEAGYLGVSLRKCSDSFASPISAVTSCCR